MIILPKLFWCAKTNIKKSSDYLIVMPQLFNMKFYYVTRIFQYYSTYNPSTVIKTGRKKLTLNADDWGYPLNKALEILLACIKRLPNSSLKCIIHTYIFFFVVDLTKRNECSLYRYYVHLYTNREIQNYGFLVKIKYTD